MVGAPFQLKAEAGAHGERTFIMIKPDGVQVYNTIKKNIHQLITSVKKIQRGLVGEIVKRFEQKGFKLVAIRLVATQSRSNHSLTFLPRMMRPGEAHLREHYADLAARPFFPGLVSLKWNRPKVLYDLPGVVHELRPSCGNGMGRPGCCQDWQVWSRLKI